VELQVHTLMLLCPNAEGGPGPGPGTGTGTAVTSQLTECTVLFERIIAVLQLMTAQKTFKTVENGV
jgi:hypothetical protein